MLHLALVVTLLNSKERVSSICLVVVENRSFERWSVGRGNALNQLCIPHGVAVANDGSSRVDRPFGLANWTSIGRPESQALQKSTSLALLPLLFRIVHSGCGAKKSSYSASSLPCRLSILLASYHEKSMNFIDWNAPTDGSHLVLNDTRYYFVFVWYRREQIHQSCSVAIVCRLHATRFLFDTGVRIGLVHP